MRRSRPGPDFIGIGPPKAGTTWLHRSLQGHPDVWTTPVKELHWFDELQAGGPFPTRELFVGRDPAAERLRFHRRQVLTRQVVGRPRDLRWKLRYLFGHRSDDAYLRAFDDAGERVAGEITPAYCELDERWVRHVHDVAPAAKIIVLLRDPIARAWSDARRLLGRHQGRAIEDIPPEEVEAFIDGPLCRVRSDYVAIVDRWQGRFGADQVHVGFFDDIVDRPAEVLQAVCSFIGVPDDPEICAALVAGPTNVGWGSGAIPERYHRRLAAALDEPMQRAAARFGGPTAAWLADAQRESR